MSSQPRTSPNPHTGPEQAWDRDPLGLARPRQDRSQGALLMLLVAEPLLSPCMHPPVSIPHPHPPPPINAPPAMADPKYAALPSIASVGLSREAGQGQDV